MEDIQPKFKKQFPEVIFDEELQPYSTFKIGGKADFFYHLKDMGELPKLIEFAKKNQIPFVVLGAGSNVLFDDAGFRGLIIRMEADKMEINDVTDGEGEIEISADCGVLISILLKKCIENGLSGLEKWAGLPGTVGGAVYGNAGCNGLETENVLKKATIFDPKNGEIKEVEVSFFDFGYRTSKLKTTHEILLKAVFKTQKMKISAQEQQKTMDDLKKNRHEKQPAGLTIGSFFKNPSLKQSAGYLIDQVGLKGKKIGQAQISEKHGNFILNLGGAKAKDVIKLAKLAKAQIKAKFGIDLEEEVQIFSTHEHSKLS